MKWIADENFRNAIVRGLLRKAPGLDIVRAQDVPQVYGEDDRVLLAFAAADDRVVVTHDLSTMIPAMRDLISSGLASALIVLVPDSLSVSSAVDDLLLLNDCAIEADWAAGVVYLPLR